MAERRRNKQRKQAELVKPSKEEYAIAKFLRFYVKTYDAKQHGAEVKYFIASEAVNALMSSKWATGRGQGDILLTTRASCVNQLNCLLQKGLFYHAEKVERKKILERKSEGKGKKEKDMESDKNEKKKSKEKDKNDGEDAQEEVKSGKKSKQRKDINTKSEGEKSRSSKEDSSKTEKSKKDEEKKKKPKKVRLQVHENQVFKDGDEEYYVWIYDPVSVKTFIIGLLLVLGVIAICLFPLWPPEVRIGISYLSWLAIGLLGLIFALYIVRLIMFVFVWCASFGKHHFWLFPNLNEDVGFWESFVPLYDHKHAEPKSEKADDVSKEDSDKSGDSAEQEKKTDLPKSVDSSNEQDNQQADNTNNECEIQATEGDKAEEEEEEEEGSDQLEGAEEGSGGEDGGDARNSDDDDDDGVAHHGASNDDDIDIDVNNDNGFEMLDPDDDDGSDGGSIPGDSDDDKKDK